MVVDDSTEKFSLFVGKGDRNGLGFDFSSPAPVALLALVQAALSHPKPLHLMRTAPHRNRPKNHS
jgi:hypothetical protein